MIFLMPVNIHLGTVSMIIEETVVLAVESRLEEFKFFTNLAAFKFFRASFDRIEDFMVNTFNLSISYLIFDAFINTIEFLVRIT